MTGSGEALDGRPADLPDDARTRLDAFARAVERIHVDDLPLHVERRRGGAHRRAVEAAELVAIENGLDGAVRAARHAMIEGLMRVYAAATLRVGYAGINAVGGGGPVEDRVRVAESVADAVTALVLWERLDAADRGELLGLWDRLLP
jgi:hypothetical protein